MPTEFDCRDCGAHIFDAAGTLQGICATCTHVPGWLFVPELAHIFGRGYMSTKTIASASLQLATAVHAMKQVQDAGGLQGDVANALAVAVTQAQGALYWIREAHELQLPAQMPEMLAMPMIKDDDTVHVFTPELTAVALAEIAEALLRTYHRNPIHNYESIEAIAKTDIEALKKATSL